MYNAPLNVVRLRNPDRCVGKTFRLGTGSILETSLFESFMTEGGKQRDRHTAKTSVARGVGADQMLFLHMSVSVSSSDGLKGVHLG